MNKKSYEKPIIQTITTRQVLDSLGPAHAGYGDPMLGMGD